MSRFEVSGFSWCAVLCLGGGAGDFALRAPTLRSLNIAPDWSASIELLLLLLVSGAASGVDGFDRCLSLL